MFVIRAKLPGALMLQATPPEGVMPVDPPRRAHLHVLDAAPVLAHVPKDELSAVLASAGKTYTRGAYHEYRFIALRHQLDRRRDEMPGDILWDSLIEPVHFELQAFAGACRTLLDELVYLIARRHGVQPASARKKPWETADLVKHDLPPACDVEEIRLLRSDSDWFDTLNAYRNSIFHHGWRHGGGHFSADDLRRATSAPSANGLLVPDRASLVGRKKPFEWTWAQGVTVDDVARDTRVGLERFLGRLLETVWQTPKPQPGVAPESQRPNMLIGLVRPVVVQTERCLILPLFSTRELGLGCQPFCKDPKLELVDISRSRQVVGQPAISFSLAGLEGNAFSPLVTTLEVLVDPVTDETWRIRSCRATASLALTDILQQGSIEPISMPEDELDRLWVWRKISTPAW